MFFLLSKTLDVLLSPLFWGLLGVALAAALVHRRPRAARRLLVAVLALLYVLGLPVTAWALQRWIESDARSTVREGEVYDAAIVLSGGVDVRASARSGQLEFQEAPERVLAGYTLWREGRVRHLFAVGGHLERGPRYPREAELVARQYVAWGVPAAAVAVENESRNTRENALEAARVVRARGWKRLVLVTSAAHLPRALGCFHAVGLRPDALAVDFRAGPGPSLSPLPREEALERSSDALREAFGRLVYRLRGYTTP